MAVIRGCEAVVQVEDPNNLGNYLVVGEANSYSYEETSNNNTFFTFGSCDARVASTSTERSFSLDGYFDCADAGQHEIDIGATRQFRLYPTGDGNTALIQFNAVIESITRAGSAGEDFQTFSMTANVTGTPTETDCWNQ